MVQKSPTNMDELLAQSNAARMEALAPTAKVAEEVARIPTEKLDEEIANSFKENQKVEPTKTVESEAPQEVIAVENVQAPKSVETATDSEFDEYGNEKVAVKPKTYTEDEVNERINLAVRERLARAEKNKQEVQSVNRQETFAGAPADFVYDPNSGVDWQQQLKSFIKQTNAEVREEEERTKQFQHEQRLQQEFEAKFHSGMSKFADFKEVVGNQPISDAMTMATRAMKDPAAFLYAASKKHAAELQRISQIGDPYTQMVEIGRLEERMKRSAPATSAPKPLRVTREDLILEEPVAPRQATIEDLIAQNDRSRLNRMRGRI